MTVSCESTFACISFKALTIRGISYQLNKETPAGTNNIKINKKENARTHFGFLAQEVKEVYPELVRTDSAGYMYVDYIGMIPLIVNALNEIQAKRMTVVALNGLGLF